MGREILNSDWIERWGNEYNWVPVFALGEFVLRLDADAWERWRGQWERCRTSLIGPDHLIGYCT